MASGERAAGSNRKCLSDFETHTQCETEIEAQTFAIVPCKLCEDFSSGSQSQSQALRVRNDMLQHIQSYIPSGLSCIAFLYPWKESYSAISVFRRQTMKSGDILEALKKVPSIRFEKVLQDCYGVISTTIKDANIVSGILNKWNGYEVLAANLTKFSGVCVDLAKDSNRLVITGYRVQVDDALDLIDKYDPSQTSTSITHSIVSLPGVTGASATSPSPWQQSPQQQSPQQQSPQQKSPQQQSSNNCVATMIVEKDIVGYIKLKYSRMYKQHVNAGISFFTDRKDKKYYVKAVANEQDDLDLVMSSFLKIYHRVLAEVKVHNIKLKCQVNPNNLQNLLDNIKAPLKDCFTAEVLSHSSVKVIISPKYYAELLKQIDSLTESLNDEVECCAITDPSTNANPSSTAAHSNAALSSSRLSSSNAASLSDIDNQKCKVNGTTNEFKPDDISAANLLAANNMNDNDNRATRAVSSLHPGLLECLHHSKDSLQLRFGSVIVKVYQRDITQAPCDAIVNSANRYIELRGGVAGAIKRVTDRKFEKEAEEYIRRHGPLNTGGIFVQQTTGQLMQLGVKYVIHVNGPTASSHLTDEECQQALIDTIRKTLEAAERKKCKSVAIPAIGSGLSGIPMDRCVDAYWLGLTLFLTKSNNNHLTSIEFINIDRQTNADIVHAFKNMYDADSEHYKRSHRDSQLPQTSSVAGASSSTGEPQATQTNGDIASSHTKHSHKHLPDTEYELCLICMDEMTPTNSELLPCKHKFCGGCMAGIRNIQKSNLCPTCKAPFAIPKGPQPNGGTMKETRSSTTHLPGYPNCGVITIDYHIPSGIQKAEHPHPGQPYSGTSRTAYLPDNVEGRRVSRLLRKAFDAGLIFNVGRSITTGADNQVVWNDIHHKTSFTGIYGYPDTNYMDSVEADLKARVMLSTTTTTDDSIIGQCLICYENSALQSLPCQHNFCERCIDSIRTVMKSHLCPTCKQPFAEPRGPQPANGTMSWTIEAGSQLPGYEGYSVIVIQYSIPGGVQTIAHPNPGVPYRGTNRVAFLPNNTQGNKVCRLLKKAFDAGLIFTVGRSLTTGFDNQVVWNDIHHKTSYTGPYGYPDPNYMDSVERDLNARGIYE